MASLRQPQLHIIPHRTVLQKEDGEPYSTYLARTLLSEATKLSGFINNTFWPQAIQHATLIINLTTLGHGSTNKSAFETIL